MERTDTDPILPREIEQWIESQPEGERPSLREAWQLDGMESNAPVVSADKMAADWDKITAQIEKPERSRLRLVLPALSAAAAVLIGLTVWAVLRPNVVKTSEAETRTVLLPDASEVSLNGRTRLAWHDDFNESERRVHLRGEAFFDVENGGLPFIVETPNAEVHVTGTQFNVWSRRVADRERTIVQVREGQVRVETSEGESEQLTVGQTANVLTGTDGVRRIGRGVAESDHIAAWQSGRFIAMDEPLEVILNEIEVRFGVRTRFSNQMPDIRITIIRQSPSLESVLDDVSESLGIPYRTRGRTVEFGP